MNRLLVLLLSLSFVSPGFAEPQGDKQNDKVVRKFLGAWRLVSVEGTDATVHRKFNGPVGMIVYDRSGRMSVQIAADGNRKPFAGGAAKGTLEEKASAFDDYAAYFGTYTLNLKEQTITHHIEQYLNPSLRGVNNVRWFEFQGNDRLLLIPREDGKGGVIERKNATFKLLWERIK